MPYKCCVPNCKGNYATGAKVSTFAFPKDPELKDKWLQAIRRKNFSPTNNTRVCELHFNPSDIERITKSYVEQTGELLIAPLKHPRLLRDAVPRLTEVTKLMGSICSASSSRREDPTEKKARIENEMLKKAIAESLATENEYIKAKSFSNLEELSDKIKDMCLSKWVTVRKPTHTYFLYFDDTTIPKVLCCVAISENLDVSVFSGDVKIESLRKYNVTFPVKVNNLSELEKLLEQVVGSLINVNGDLNKNDITSSLSLVRDILTSLVKKVPEKYHILEFLSEQVSLIDKNKFSVRYSCQTLLLCGLLQSISPHAYKFIRNSGNLILPSPRTVQMVCSKFSTDPRLEQSQPNLLRDVSSKFKLLGEQDKTVILMMDEIHLKPYMDYKAGNIVGGAYNSAVRATSAHVFMLNSLRSPYKEVAHILPVKTLPADALFCFIKKIIVGLEEIGFSVIAVVADNNAINKKAMSLFSTPPEYTNCYPHPANPANNLFFVSDSVHLLKNIRNNWLNQKYEKEMIYPEFHKNSGTPVIKIASFDALKQMHTKEEKQLLKYGYTLTLKSLYPTSIERQNVKLALQVFNSSTVTALRELGPKINLDNYEDTADYIEIIVNWWNIVNVKTLLKGQRLKNPFQEPLTKESNHIFKYLSDFMEWLNRWQASGTIKGKLTKETHSALYHTTDGLLKIANYCFSIKKYNFILLGQIQTDKLEERFGKYRYQAGAQYHVSMRQIFETEGKLRMQSVVPLILKSKSLGDIKITKDDIFTFADEGGHSLDNCQVPESLRKLCDYFACDLDDIPDTIWPCLVHVAGYAAYSALKKLQCQYCKMFLTESGDKNFDTSLISANNRGGLCYPNYDVVLCAAYTYLVVTALLENDHEFLKFNNQRQIVKSLVADILDEMGIELFLGHACIITMHIPQEIIKMILHSITNILLNNYTKRQNDTTYTKSMPLVKRLKR